MSNISIGYTVNNNIRKIDLMQTNSILIAGGSEPLRHSLVKVLIVNDYSDYILASGKEGRAYASRIRRNIEYAAKKGHTVGMNVILVVGRPCVDVLPNSLKKNFTTRICFKTLTGVDSYAVIDIRKACEIESSQLILWKEYECEVLKILQCNRD